MEEKITERDKQILGRRISAFSELYGETREKFKKATRYCEQGFGEIFFVACLLLGYKDNDGVLEKVAEPSKENFFAGLIMLKYLKLHFPYYKDEWIEDEDGYSLFWDFPLNNPPEVTDPLCDGYKDYLYTHFTNLPDGRLVGEIAKLRKLETCCRNCTFYSKSGDDEGECTKEDGTVEWTYPFKDAKDCQRFKNGEEFHYV
jgi:hypothetical protein